VASSDWIGALWTASPREACWEDPTVVNREATIAQRSEIFVRCLGTHRASGMTHRLASSCLRPRKRGSEFAPQNSATTSYYRTSKSAEPYRF